MSDQMVMPIVTKAHQLLMVQMATLGAPPMHVQMRPGGTFTPLHDQYRDECCDGIAWVRPGSQTPTGGSWPTALFGVDGPSASRATPVYYAVQLELGLERCMPLVSNVEGEGNAFPTAAQWEQATLEHLDDAAALRRTVTALRSFYGNDAVLFGPVTPLQNEGQCGGQIVVVTVRAPACD